MPPQVNATLTAVNGADASTGGLDDWDAPAAPAGGAAAGPVKWQGAADAYYSETVRRAAGDVADVVEARILFVESSVARAAGIDTDDVLTFTDPAGVVRRARARVVAVRELAGVPARLQTARLELAPVGA